LEKTLIYKEEIEKGAEATIFRGFFLNSPAILKRRYPKEYRLPQIDQTIRTQRLKAEARIMTLAWKIGARIPALLGIDFHNRILIIEELYGVTLFSMLTSTTFTELETFFDEVGQQIGLLHRNDIIHGDLTVFNVVVDVEKRLPYLIDFGLSQISSEIEKKGDDALTFYNTLKAISSQYKDLFESFQTGYLKVHEEGSNTFELMRKIQSRARYIARDERLI